jgi:hypothetical protein
MQRASADIDRVWFDTAHSELQVGFSDGREVGWSQLSDGHRVLLYLFGAWLSA